MKFPALRLHLGSKRAKPTSTGLPPERGLFIIGAARSGTTILQNALNHADAIFLLGEPNLHLEMGEPNFASRYNAMHRSWLNQKTKSTYCPPILPVDGSATAYLDRLAQTYKWVGAKIVMNNRRSPDWLERLLGFHFQNFYTARYIFTFRNPRSVVGSTQGLQLLGGADVDPISSLLANYLEVIELFTYAVRNLPHVRAAFHEDIGEEELRDIGHWLGVDLSSARDYYDQSKVRTHSTTGISADDLERLDQVTQLYDDLRHAVKEGLRTPQIEQNDGNFSANHYTPLGHIARRAETMRIAFRAIRRPAI